MSLIADLFGDAEEREREPDPDEIEAMRAAEWEFRFDNELMDDEAYSAYCTAYAESWIEDQVKDMSPATREALVAERRHEPPARPKATAPAPSTEGGVPLVRRGKRGQYELTPPEAKFYDALVETGLTFTVQPWARYVETAFRPDFFVHYDGKVVAVEIDGHDWHKTKE